jgi:hypothetical protein
MNPNQTKIAMKTMNTTRTGSHLRAALKHPTLAIAFAVAAVLGSAQAAIPVGPSGSGTITFDTLPAATEWATVASIPGNGGTAVDLTGLDTLVNTLAATGITAGLGTVAADPAGTTTQDGKWNSAALRLTSRAGTSAATCFMATLLNTSGAAINEMDINFTLSGSAPAGEDTGMAGYALYYSLTGGTNSWQRVGVYGTPGAVSVTNIPLSGPWADAANLYVLWVDDNGNNGGDGWYGFDDVSFAKAVPAANILTFGPGATIGPVSANAAAISWTVASGSDPAALSPDFTLSPGATCEVLGNPVVSGSTQNFTSPVHYIVYSSDYVAAPPAGKTTDYTVTVTVIPPSPGGVTDLALWLDASDSSTMTIDGTTVTEWRDKKGSAAKMTTQAGTPTLVASGIGGIPTVSCNTSSWMNDGVNHGTPVTVFYVSRQTGGANNRVLSSSNNNWLLGYWSGKKGNAYFDGNVFLDGNGNADTAPHLYAATIPGSGQNSTFWAEGEELASNQGGTTGPNNLQLNGWEGGNENSNCEISEVLVYHRVLNSNELEKVGGYLAGKYSLTTSYPTNLTLTLTSPQNNQAYPSGTSISATATVFAGTAPYNVKFFTRSLPGGTFGQAGGDLTTSPYTLDLGALSAGSYEIYAEVTDSAGSPATDTSATHTFTVAPAAATTTTLATSGSPSTYGDSVTFTATVNPVPTGGTVQFYKGFDSVGTPVAVNTTTGEASVTTSTLGVVGPNEITAEYSGFQIYDPSTTAAVITQVVDKAPLTVKADNVYRLENTANPALTYKITGFKNGQTLANSGVTGTPGLSTTADLASPLGDYPITCALGDLAADNYSFTLEDGSLIVTNITCLLGVFNLGANGGINPATGNPWAVGDTYRLVFLTSQTTQANSSEINDYNAFVQSVAAGSTAFPQLGNTSWKLIGSTATVDARDNTGTNPGSGVGVPIFRLDSVMVANDNNDLWDESIDANISITEEGQLLDEDRLFTGSNENGEASEYPFGTADYVQTAHSLRRDWAWMKVWAESPNASNSVYAMSAVLTLQIAGSNNFASWISTPSFNIAPAAQGFNFDADGDGLANGIEAWFGTNPGVSNAGLTSTGKSGTVFNFQHPEANLPLGDVSGSYEWSINLSSWYAPGTVGDTTVTITATPGAGVATVEVDTAGSAVAPTKLFVRGVATQN